MLLLTHSTAVLCAVFIITGAVSGEEVKKAVGGTVSFRPDKLGSPVTSITWKQIKGGMVVKAIEWDEDDGVSIPNPRFQGFTTLDNKTGQITITNLKVEHSGVYTIDISSKEQQQRFTLEVMERVPKPVIDIEKSNDPDVYLRCGYNGTIIWKNSAGDTLKGTKNQNPGEFINVTNTRNPENFYTCTLKNDVSEETSDRVYERNLFVIERVPKPEITIEKSSNTDVYLRCEYSGTIIWKNSAGDTLQGTKNHTPGEFITVTNTRNPENFYTCTLKNAVSEETSDPVYERDLFIGGGPWWIALIVIPILLVAAFILLYKFYDPFHAFVSNNLKDKPCIGALLNRLDGTKKDPPKSSSDAENGAGSREKTETDLLKSPSPAENDPLKCSNDAENGEGSREKTETDPLTSSSPAENGEEPPKADRDGGDKEDHL